MTTSAVTWEELNAALGDSAARAAFKAHWDKHTANQFCEEAYNKPEFRKLVVGALEHAELTLRRLAMVHGCAIVLYTERRERAELLWECQLCLRTS